MIDDRAAARDEYWSGRQKRTYRCPGCGRTREEVVEIDVHHRDGNPSNNHPDNLVALCRRCHLGEQHDRPTHEEALDPEQPTGTRPRTPASITPETP